MPEISFLGAAESGTKSGTTITLTGLAGVYDIECLFSEVENIANGVTGTVTVRKDSANWAAYSGVTYVSATPAIDLSTGTLLEGKGTVSDGAVTVLGLGKKSIDVADIDLDGADDIGAALADADLILVDDGAGGTNRKAAMSSILIYAKTNDLTGTVTPGGRLTLESGVSVSITDQTAKSTIYYTPHVHNFLPLWDDTNSRWVLTAFTETSLAVGTVTSGLPHDVFGYLDSGSLVLEKLAWTNITTRATPISKQDGLYCKTGDHTWLYLGTFASASTTTTEDSEQNRLVYNHYQQIERAIKYSTGSDNHTWTPTGAGANVTRAWNNSTTHKTTIMCGFPVKSLGAAYAIMFSYTGTFASIMSVRGMLNEHDNDSGTAGVGTGYGIDAGTSVINRTNGQVSAITLPVGLNTIYLCERTYQYTGGEFPITLNYGAIGADVTL
jgi:hypothetical protein